MLVWLYHTHLLYSALLNPSTTLTLNTNNAPSSNPYSNPLSPPHPPTSPPPHTHTQVEEEDMLDLASELTDTSRLSCQIDVTSLLQGAEIVVPGDGF